ncbi:helix-turn-helix domain-containing protein [Nocardia sp. NPDC050710]|uniref:GbsR/MarR family transcriptional regulator n=1 Tax=Nocardia sp. NPDC050710 TaxID=3157220 RepID=UPI00340C8AA3
MPGGRLTEQDRRHIAAGLAAGLDYAEIARRVGRPTSTVTRELARNGGPRGYRADLAQRATRRRARRRIATAPQELSAAAFERDDETVREFAEQFAALMVDSGLPRMAARVLASLFTTDSGSATAAELARRLQVSPASISKAVAYLDGLEVIRRAKEGRRERYAVDDNVWCDAWSDSARTTNRWAEAAERGAEIFGATKPVGERLEHMGLFFARLGRDIAGGPVDTVAGEHALTVIAALVHSGTQLTPEQLAAALEWPLDRVTSALHDADRHPDLADPVAVRGNKAGTYYVVARPDRLTTAQRRRLAGTHRRPQ